MPTATFYGASDDLIEIEGVPGADEFNVIEDSSDLIAKFVIGGKVRVHAIYDGCWSFAVGQVDEDIPLPEWPIRVAQSPKSHYSAQLEIDVPDGVGVVMEAKRK